MAKEWKKRNLNSTGFLVNDWRKFPNKEMAFITIINITITPIAFQNR